MLMTNWTVYMIYYHEQCLLVESQKHLIVKLITKINASRASFCAIKARKQKKIKKRFEVFRLKLVGFSESIFSNADDCLARKNDLS